MEGVAAMPDGIARARARCSHASELLTSMWIALDVGNRAAFATECDMEMNCNTFREHVSQVSERASLVSVTALLENLVVRQIEEFPFRFPCTPRSDGNVTVRAMSRDGFVCRA